jgi:hypothetical protein
MSSVRDLDALRKAMIFQVVLALWRFAGNYLRIA